MPKPITRTLNLVRSTGLISRLAYARGRQAGVDVAKLLRRSGLTTRDMDDEHTRLSVNKQIKFIELIADTIGDNNFGFHLAQEFDLREIGLLYYVAASANTLGDALRRAERYSSIVNEGIVLTVQREKSLRIFLKYNGVTRHTDRHQIEFWITALIRTIRHLTNRRISPSCVHLVHYKNDKTGEFMNFVGGRIKSDSNVDVVDLAASNWNVPLVKADPFLHRLLLQFCEEALVRQELPGNSFKVRVENAIAMLLPHGRADSATVAARLRLSPRSLARRLSSEQLTFGRLLRELRRSLAHRYLADKDLSISQIAWLLGYKEVGAFTHAFRRWTGRSPRAARARRRR
jgi:AraC-like DNA-binding protein